MTSIVELLEDHAESDDPSLSWDVHQNSTGAIRVTAATVQSWPDRPLAYEAAEDLLEDLLGLGYSIRGGTASQVGAIGPDDVDASWRGRVDVVLEENAGAKHP